MFQLDMTRRRAVQLAVACAATAALPRLAMAEDVALPATGDAIPDLELFDQWIRAFLAEHRVPGGQLAISYNGKLIYSRGFGYADREGKNVVQPASLFRIASVSKPITAVAILRLVQQKKLQLEDRVDNILKIEPHVEPATRVDERWKKITIAHLLAHTGGWNRETAYDPMFAYGRIAKSLGIELPIGTAEIIRYMRGQPLDSDPGDKYAYSNFGYCLLGRVIEKLSGESYEAYVKREVFAPLGITKPRIGGSLENQRVDGEVRYYVAGNERATPVVGPHAGDESQPVPLAYGGWNHEALDAHGGWIASSEDLVRFASAFDTSALRESKPLLGYSLVRQMFAPQATVRGKLGYGYGWLVWTPEGETLPAISHAGALPCTAAVLLKLRGNLNLAALFNLGKSKTDSFIASGLDAKLASLASGVSKWPA